MPRHARALALPLPRVLLAATLLPLIGLWLARPAHAMEFLGAPFFVPPSQVH